ncbi:hypothetical protein C8J57DRAFT_1312966 [Mycena rebaudengoi]|nr:hypothetical protein C8J57DRAFT_1312966 [Mycena rebaudengoi]
MPSKTILITGSNTGVGFAAAHMLAAEGHTVYLAARNESAGREAVAKIKKEKSLDVKFVQLDVTDIASIKAAVATVEKAEGKLDVLVNNAGISGWGRTQTATDAESITTIQDVFATNFFGVIQTTTAFLPLLRAASTPAAPAVILNVSSAAGSNTTQAGPEGVLMEFVAYNASKAALNAYTIYLAHALKAEGIKLNGYMPGGKTIEHGAEVLVKWSLLDKDGATGLFVDDAGEIPW